MFDFNDFHTKISPKVAIIQWPNGPNMYYVHGDIDTSRRYSLPPSTGIFNKLIVEECCVFFFQISTFFGR